MQHNNAIRIAFHPGDLVATPGFMTKCPRDYAMAALLDHLKGEWGQCCTEDWDLNDQALRNGGRLLSVFPLPAEEGNFWIITEAVGDNGRRAATTFLLPSEY